MNPAFGILIFAIIVIVWVLFVFLVYPFCIEPLIRIFRNEYKKTKRNIDETIEDMINEKDDD